jgi:hypothetical protein
MIMQNLDETSTDQSLLRQTETVSLRTIDELHDDMGIRDDHAVAHAGKGQVSYLFGRGNPVPERGSYMRQRIQNRTVGRREARSRTIAPIRTE